MPNYLRLISAMRTLKSSQYNLMTDGFVVALRLSGLSKYSGIKMSEHKHLVSITA